MAFREKISYLIPRDPSIQSWDDRVKLSGPSTKNLIQLGLDETMGGKIKVYLRLKPSSTIDNAYKVLNSTTLQTEAPKESVSYKNVTNGIGKLIHNFTFTSVLEQNITQAELFTKCAANSLKKFLKGENYLLMAYGTTSAGKTFTMQGNIDQPGVIPRALDFVFNSLKNNIIPFCKYQPHQYNEFVVFNEEQAKKYHGLKNFILSLDLTKCQRYPEVSQTTLSSNSSSGFSEMYENMTFKEMQAHLKNTESMELDSSSYKYSVWVSMIEIYNEQVYDLLDLPNEKGVRPKLTFRDDEFGNTFVKNLRYVNVSSGHEAFQILQFGRNNLHFAPTALNHSSSRSHCIFTITVAKFLNYETSSCAVMSRYSFCDLAGMERAKKTLNVKDRMVESKAINTSLSILVKCLTIIKENQNNKEKKMIPYRESKLTKLFREAVTGKEQFSLIVNVTTEPNLFDETLHVLKFSAIAQKIVPQNVFVKPNLMRRAVKSRFSQIVTDSSYNSKAIDWDNMPVATNKIKEEYTSEVDDLKEVIEKLKGELYMEQKRCEEIENNIREELTTKFSEMLKKQGLNNQLRLENEREELQEMYEMREKRLIKFCELMHKNKRQKMNDDEESRENKNQERKIEELEQDKEFLVAKNESLTQQIQKLTEDHNKSLLECSTLKFTIAEKDRILEELKRTINAKTNGEGALELELRKQLEEAKTKLADYKVLLDEAAVDYKELEENNKYLRNENEVLEQCLTEQKDATADRNNEIAELQKMLSQKRIMVEKLEDTNDKLVQKLNEADRLKESCENSMADIYKKELESLREQFKKTSEKLNESRQEFDAVKAEKSNLENELGTFKKKIIDLENKILSLETNSEKEEEIERVKNELSVIKSEMDIVKKEKAVLQEQCNELNLEIGSLQKDIKNMITNNEEKRKTEFETELLAVKEKLGKQIEESELRERDSKLLIETLQAKIKEMEHQINETPRLEEAIQNLIIDHEKNVNKLRDENDRLQKQISMQLRIFNDCGISPTALENCTDLKFEKIASQIRHNENELVSNSKNQIEADEGTKNKPGEYLDTNSQSSDVDNSSEEKKKLDLSPQKLTKHLENLSLQTKSTRKKVDLMDETVHPSTIKRANKGRKKTEKVKKEKESEKVENQGNSSIKKGKCYKKLFTENDFDGLTDLNSSPSENEIPRLRPRK